MNTSFPSRPAVATECQVHDHHTHHLLEHIVQQQTQIIQQNSQLIQLLTQNEINTSQTSALCQHIDATQTNILTGLSTISNHVSEISQNTASNASDVAKISGAVRFGPTAIAIANTVATPIFTAPVG